MKWNNCWINLFITYDINKFVVFKNEKISMIRTFVPTIAEVCGS